MQHPQENYGDSLDMWQAVCPTRLAPYESLVWSDCGHLPVTGWQGSREVLVRNHSRKGVMLMWDNATIKEQVVRSKRSGANQVSHAFSCSCMCHNNKATSFVSSQTSLLTDYLIGYLGVAA